MKSALAAALLFAGAVALAEVRVVLGSFQNAQSARDLAAQASQRLGADLAVAPFEKDGRRLYRVVSPAASEAEAIALRDRAIAGGWLDAWLLRGAPAAPRASDDDSAAQVSAPAAQDAAPTAARAQPEAQRRELPGPAEAASAPSPGPSEAERSPLRVATPTGEIIHVPGFGEGELGFQLDGRLDEAFWAAVPGYDNMVVVEPDTLAAARFETIVRFAYTERGLYVGAWMQQPPESLLARLSSRDEYINRDSFGLTLDTSGEGLYGYWFSVNLGGSVMDGKVAPEREFSYEWDGPWDSATAETADGWSAEMFLPWAMMAMPAAAEDRQMGFWVNRKVAYIDERWGWPALPFTAARFMSALGKLKLPEVAPKRQLSLFPYLSGAYDHAGADEAVDTGLDVFWRPSPDFQVTAAVSPDFGAVESDDVVINLTATETFFPEKRLFFLEGNETFLTSPRGRMQGFGRSTSVGARSTGELFTPPPTTVLNTRRIGGKALIDIPDDVEVAGHEESRPTDLLGAAKFTGHTGPFRYGLLTAFEDEPELRGTKDGRDVVIQGEGRNFAVLRGLVESTAAGRRSAGYIGTLLDHPLRQAAVHGLDAHYLAANGHLKLDAQLLHSDIDDFEDGRERGYGGFLDVAYTPRRGVQHFFGLDYLDDTLDINDLGFLGRNDLQGMRYAFNYTRSNMKRFRQWRAGMNFGYWVNDAGRAVRRGVFLRNALTFNNRSELRMEANYFPWRWDDIESRGNGSYRIDDRWQTQVAWGTDTSKPFSWSIQGGMASEDLHGWQYRAGVGFTLKPGHRFSLDVDVNYRYREAWLLHQEDRRFATFRATDWQPRIAMDLFLTARQQLRLTVQWAGIRSDELHFYEVPEGDGPLLQVPRMAGAPPEDFTISRLAMQLRYRWQIAPLSDLFVVYTRGSNLPDRQHAQFEDLFRDALTDPVIDLFVVKLRYRFGS